MIEGLHEVFSPIFKIETSVGEHVGSEDHVSFSDLLLDVALIRLFYLSSSCICTDACKNRTPDPWWYIIAVVEKIAKSQNRKLA